MATYQDFARLFLQDIGAPDTLTNEQFIEGWGSAEGTRAANNILATTQHAAGSTQFNTAGVQNFPTLAEGAAANAQVLENGRYPNILAALRSSDAAALGFPSGTPSAAIWGDLGVWTTGQRDAPVGTYIRHIFAGLGNAGHEVGGWLGGSSGPDNTVPSTAPSSTSTSTPVVTAPLQVNAGTLIMIGAVFLIILVAAGTIKAKNLVPGGQ